MMLTKRIKILAPLSFLLGLMTCDNYEFPKAPYPRVETLPVLNISAMGATFQANIKHLGNSPITNHGFIWGTSETITINTSDKIEFGPALAPGVFEAEIKSGLGEGVYFVKAFVKTVDQLIYGQLVTFTSKGSSAPIIESFSPTQGSWGDTILVTGKYFSYGKETNIGYLGTVKLETILATDTLLKFSIPPSTNEKSVNLYVETFGKKTASSNSFTYLSPTITSVSSLEAAYSDTLTISFNYYNPNHTTVLFDFHLAEIISMEQNSIDVKVPNSLNTTTPIIKVSSGGFSDEMMGFKLKKPELLATQPQTITAPNQEYTITGKNLNPEKRFNQIKIYHSFGTYEVLESEILEASSNKIKILLNETIFGNLSETSIGEISMDIQINGFTTNKTLALVNYTSTWTKKNRFPECRDIML